MMNQTPGRPETVPDAICIVIITARDSLDPFEYILQIVCLSEKNECIYIVQMGIITREKFTVYRLGDFYMTGEKLLFYLWFRDYSCIEIKNIIKYMIVIYTSLSWSIIIYLCPIYIMTLGGSGRHLWISLLLVIQTTDRTLPLDSSR